MPQPLFMKPVVAWVTCTYTIIGSMMSGMCNTCIRQQQVLRSYNAMALPTVAMPLPALRPYALAYGLAPDAQHRMHTRAVTTSPVPQKLL